MLFGMVTLIIVLVTKVGGLPGHLYAELNLQEPFRGYHRISSQSVIFLSLLC